MSSFNAANQAFPTPPRALPVADAQHRIDRLRELRAVIEALRTEQEVHDPLLAWVVGQDRSRS